MTVATTRKYVAHFKRSDRALNCNALILHASIGLVAGAALTTGCSGVGVRKIAAAEGGSGFELTCAKAEACEKKARKLCRSPYYTTVAREEPSQPGDRFRLEIVCPTDASDHPTPDLAQRSSTEAAQPRSGPPEADQPEAVAQKPAQQGSSHNHQRNAAVRSPLSGSSAKPGSDCSSSRDGSHVACGCEASTCEGSRDGSQIACGGAAAICESSRDGSHVACGGKATVCEASRDGSQVACGGRATICEGSRDGSHVACGGKATICEHSRDGSDVACGGKATTCEGSRDGSHIACGGQATICEGSRDGSRVACGGEATICEGSRGGSHVACGGEATICEQSRDGSQVACGGRATVCEDSRDGTRVACGGEATTCDNSRDGSDIACGGATGCNGSIAKRGVHGGGVPGGAVIDSHIAAEFEGWDGDTIFELANGQIWQQAEYSYVYHYAYRPRVLIFRDREGIVRMHVDGVEQTLRVVRVR